MGPELALAIDTCVTESTALVITIVKKIHEVRVWKRRCKNLGSDALTLTELLDKRRSAIQSIASLRALKDCLERVASFVEACATYNLVEVSIDVLLKRTYPSLRKELLALRELFLFESVTEILVRESAGTKEILEKQSALLNGQSSANATLQRLHEALREQKRAQAQHLGLSPLLHSDADFALGDDVKVDFPAGNASPGQGRLKEVGPVICYPILDSPSAKANLDIYRSIQEGAFVQRFYGTLRAPQGLFAVMEDLQHVETLNYMLQGDYLAKPLATRMKVASDLAKTVAWYHKAQLLLKSISDATVAWKTGPSGVEYPIFTKLENVRNIYQRTTNFEYDTRYEAPEYASTREHSNATDVWSLGILLWQCVSGKFPFGESAEVAHGSAKSTEIRQHLSRGDQVGSLESLEDVPELAALVGRCWHRDPMARPTASDIALTLIGLSARVASLVIPAHSDIRPSSTSTDRPEEQLQEELQQIQQRSLLVVREARDLNRGAVNLVQLDKKIDASDFEKLVEEEDGTDALISFIVGAAIYWNVCQTSEEETLIPAVILSDDCRRALQALPFLENALQGGYRQAYLELYKAHALLAREYKASVPSSNEI